MDNQIKNNKEEVPLAHYMEEFARIDTLKRADELGVEFVNSTFKVRMYGDLYSIHWPDGAVSCENPSAIGVVSASGHIMLLRYLITGQNLPTGGSFKTFRELPWGEVYIKPFTGRCITRLAYKFNGQKERFTKAALALGGKQLQHGDAAFEFNFMEDYHIIIIMWEADDEFPPNSQIEFSDNFALGFSAEDNVVAAELLITAISNKMKEI